jgi:hypothetical protein
MFGISNLDGISTLITFKVLSIHSPLELTNKTVYVPGFKNVALVETELEIEVEKVPLPKLHDEMTFEVGFNVPVEALVLLKLTVRGA